jgi:hypothetical protein
VGAWGAAVFIGVVARPAGAGAAGGTAGGVSAGACGVSGADVSLSDSSGCAAFFPIPNRASSDCLGCGGGGGSHTGTASGAGPWGGWALGGVDADDSAVRGSGCADAAAA